MVCELRLVTGFEANFWIVRVSAKELTALIMDEERLRTERNDRKTWKSRVTGIEDGPPQQSGSGPSEGSSRRRERRPQQTDEDDLEYKLAIEASKNEAEEDAKRRQSRDIHSADDDDLEKAIRLSKEEEELRRRELEDSNKASLFDDFPTPTTTQPQFTGYNQGYQQQGAVDWFGNPVDPNSQQQQQQQNTGYLNNAYNQGFQGQPTGFQNGFPQQQTGFDPSLFQQQQSPTYLQPQSTLQPQNTLQPQVTAFNTTNPYAQQNNDFLQLQQQQQQQLLQQQQQQQGLSPTTGNNNPWATTQQTNLDSLKPMATGSNNPFASGFNRPQPPVQTTSAPSLNTLAEHRPVTNFTQPTPNPITNFSSPIPLQQQQQQQSSPQFQQHQKQELDPTRARLNALLASGEGMDTFGNTGDLRIPAQHTAPGTFVNSAGQNLNRLHAAQTGNNPFFGQQFTGVPNTTGFGGNQVPAQTGPATMFGQGANSNNPFGRQGQGGQSGSLIDL